MFFKTNLNFLWRWIKLYLKLCDMTWSDLNHFLGWKPIPRTFLQRMSTFSPLHSFSQLALIGYQCSVLYNWNIILFNAEKSFFYLKLFPTMSTIFSSSWLPIPMNGTSPEYGLDICIPVGGKTNKLSVKPSPSWKSLHQHLRVMFSLMLKRVSSLIQFQPFLCLIHDSKNASSEDVQESAFHYFEMKKGHHS